MPASSSVSIARIAAACASASICSTPGMIGRPGKWPWKNCSLKLTALTAWISSSIAQVDDPVDQQQRIAVRQGVEDLRDVVGTPRPSAPASLMPCPPSRLSGPGPARRRPAAARCCCLLLRAAVSSSCCTCWYSWTDCRCGCQPAGTLVETVGTSVLSCGDDLVGHVDRIGGVDHRRRASGSAEMLLAATTCCTRGAVAAARSARST